MPSPLLNLADELRTIIVDIIERDDIHDVVNLSSTCRSYRNLLVPKLFQTVILRNSEKSGQAIKEFLRSKNSIFVRNLHYKGKSYLPPDHILGPSEKEIDTSGDIPETILSDATREILSDLKSFSNLEQLIIEFEWDDEQLSWAFYHFDEDETVHQTNERESKDAWRALMAKTYAAIGTNKATSKIKSLEFRNVLPKVPSSWKSADFIEFLGSVLEFKISIYAMENGVGWCMNTNEGYFTFLYDIGRRLTTHLDTVETLSIAANDYGPIGSEGIRHMPSFLRLESMPKLKYLNLQYFILDLPLIRFIESHIDVLEGINLEDCYAAVSNGLAEAGIPWKDFFDRITAKQPTKLKLLAINPATVKMPWGNVCEDEEDDEEYINGKALLDSGRKPFSYGYLVITDCCKSLYVS